MMEKKISYALRVPGYEVKDKINQFLTRDAKLETRNQINFQYSANASLRAQYSKRGPSPIIYFSFIALATTCSYC